MLVPFNLYLPLLSCYHSILFEYTHDDPLTRGRYLINYSILQILRGLATLKPHSF